jgi:hypothetical protein
MHGGHLGPPCPFFRFAKYELSDSAGGLSMKGLLLKVVMAVTVGILLFAIPAAAQLSPTTKKAATVRITQGPEIERADPNFAIITWTCNNPGGTPEHEGIVRYGMDPNNLSQTAKSPIRLNPGHPYTVFRVRMPGLTPKTTYYYTVASAEANGKSDGVKSPVKHFTTP